MLNATYTVFVLDNIMKSLARSQNSSFLYQQVVSMVLEMRDTSALRAGDKLPSLRAFSKSLSVSLPTVRQGYLELERLGVIESRPKSGYFLKADLSALSGLQKPNMVVRPRTVKKQVLIEEVFDAIHRQGTIPLGLANPSSAYPSDKTLARIMRRAIATPGDRALTYAPMEGLPALRRQIATRYLELGMQVNPDEVLITNGGQESIAIAVQSVAKPGDVIAVESPTYFGVLELIESFGMKALEIPLCPVGGVAFSDVKNIVAGHSVKAVVLSSSVSNPLGSMQNDKDRAEIVDLLEAQDIPLIEDDVYGELYFGKQRGGMARMHAEKKGVLSCSSFSKTAAPGYRIGWLLPGKHLDQAKKIKRALSCSSPLLNQWVLSDFVASGDYDRNIRMLKTVLKTNKQRALALVQECFPSGTRVNDPQGGGVLWVELPGGCSGYELFKRGLEHDISIAPGDLFSPSQKYKNFVRISFGVPWSDRIEIGFRTLGRLASDSH